MGGIIMKHTLKQTLAAILAAAMMTAVYSTGVAAAEQNDAALLGDVDGDGAVTITDATFIQHKLAGVPLLYAGNFTWTELYREFLPERIWQTYAGCYAKIKHSVLYALHNNEMLEFLKNSELSEVSVTARPFDEMSVAEIKSRHRRPIVFVALGMSAQFREPVDVSGVPYDFYTTEGVPLEGDNAEVIPYTTINTQDYVAAADYVITKAGWTTVSECLLARKPMALFSRDGVLEDRTTIKQLEEKHLAVPVTQDELHNIMDIIEKLDMLDGSYSGFYDCADEVAERLISL